MKSSIQYISIVLMVLLMSGCDLINPEENVPSLLYLTAFEVADNPSLQEGSLHQKIVAADVFVGGEIVGVVNLPGEVPVYLDGTQEVLVYPLVQENGSSLQLARYNFLQLYEGTVNLSISKTDTLQSITIYNDAIETVFENFESPSLIFADDLDNDSVTTIVRTEEGGLAGEGYAGKIVLTKDNPIFEVASVNDIDVEGVFDIWLEVDYKTEVDVRFGFVDTDLTGTITPNYEFGVRPKDEWNKVYYNMRPIIAALGVKKLRLAITAFLPTDADTDLDEATIYLDNIKLVYRR